MYLNLKFKFLKSIITALFCGFILSGCGAVLSGSINAQQKNLISADHNIYIICNDPEFINILIAKKHLNDAGDIHLLYSSLFKSGYCYPYNHQYADALQHGQQVTYSYNIKKVIDAKEHIYQVNVNLDDKTNLYAWQVDTKSDTYRYLTILLNSKSHSLDSSI